MILILLERHIITADSRKRRRHGRSLSNTGQQLKQHDNSSSNMDYEENEHVDERSCPLAIALKMVGHNGCPLTQCAPHEFPAATWRACLSSLGCNHTWGNHLRRCQQVGGRFRSGRPKNLCVPSNDQNLLSKANKPRNYRFFLHLIPTSHTVDDSYTVSSSARP